MEELDVAHTIFSKSTCQQAVVGEGFLAGLGAIHFVGSHTLLLDIEGVGGTGLHAVGHFVLGDAGLDFGVEFVLEFNSVEIGKLVQQRPRTLSDELVGEK